VHISGSMRKSSGDAEAGGKQWKTVGDKRKVRKMCGSEWKTRKGSEGVRKAVGAGGRGEKTWKSNGTLQTGDKPDPLYISICI